MTPSSVLYLARVNLSLCGQQALAGRTYTIDLDCPDTQASIIVGLLVGQADDGTFPEVPITAGSCCGSR